ncbi:MAG: hypothetical protein WBA63_04945 [Thermomicrobiales bacterium]
MKPFIALLVIVCVIATSVLPLPAGRTAAADEPCPDDGSLCAMLGLLPDLLNDPSGSYDQVYYDNYAEHLRRFGFTTPTSFEGEAWDHFVAASFDFAGAGDYLRHVTFWEQQMGYSPFSIEHVIALQHLPGSITLLRGRFDRSSVEAFWSASGYTANTVNGVVFWKLRGDNEQNVLDRPLRDSPRYNYAIFVRENVIAYSSTALGINATVQAASGRAPTLATNEAVAPLLAHVPTELASAVLGRGAQFGSSSTWMMFGVTPGGPARTNPRTGTPVSIPADTPLRHAYAALLYGPGVDVTQTATAISSAFLSGNSARTERPYTEYFQELNVTADAPNQVVAVDYASQPTNQAGLFAFLLNDDLGFLI